MNYKSTILSAIFCLFLYACGNQSKVGSVEDAKEPEVEEVEEEVVKEVPAVSIWDKVSVRDSPSAKGKYITALSLGESLTYLGEEAEDDKKKKYYKIKLNDGKEGWARYEFVLNEAKAAVFISDTDLYKRPDLLTKTDKKFSQMDIVGATEPQGDWVEISGKRSDGKWIDKGWVKISNLSFKAEDIAVAKFAIPVLALEDVDKKIAGIEDLLGNSDLQSSDFMPVLKEKMDDIVMNRSTMEDEMEEVVEAANDSTSN